MESIVDQITSGVAGMTVLERAEYEKWVKTPLTQRLDPEVVDLADAEKPEFVNKLSLCNVLHHPVAHAFRLAFSNPTLGLARKPYRIDTTDGEDAIDEDDTYFAEQTLLVCTEARVVKIRIPIPGQAPVEKTLNVGFMMQLLPLTRDMNAPVPVFANGNRARGAGMKILERALVGKNAGLYLSWAATNGIYIRGDYDILSTFIRNEELGLAAGPRAIDPYHAQLFMQASVAKNPLLRLPAGSPTLEEVPASFGPRAAWLTYFAAYREHRNDPTMAAFVQQKVAELQYPHSVVREEIKYLAERVIESHTKKFKSIRAADSSLLRIIPALWALPVPPPPPPPPPPVRRSLQFDASREDAMDLDES